MDINAYSTWLEIDLNALKNNVAEAMKMTGRDVMAVIKANGYGHGMRPIAQACVAGGATWCGVARMKKLWLYAGLEFQPHPGVGIYSRFQIPDAIEHNVTVALFNAD